ncbi:MAG: DUF4160 domain-containing protein [Proteobacteria bacterium]|nr:DUF4160 domain-containing protein [Pseudomonadota bacterium]
MKFFCKDVEIGYLNGYSFHLHYGPRKNGDEHTPPHLHAYYNGRKGKFCICNSYKGKIGDMFDGTMKPQEQAFVKTWILQNKSKLNRRWRSQNFTRLDSTFNSNLNDIQKLVNAIKATKAKLRLLLLKLTLKERELDSYSYYCSRYR